MSAFYINTLYETCQLGIRIQKTIWNQPNYMGFPVKVFWLVVWPHPPTCWFLYTYIICTLLLCRTVCLCMFLAMLRSKCQSMKCRLKQNHQIENQHHFGRNWSKKWHLKKQQWGKEWLTQMRLAEGADCCEAVPVQYCSRDTETSKRASVWDKCCFI